MEGLGATQKLYGGLFSFLKGRVSGNKFLGLSFYLRNKVLKEGFMLGLSRILPPPLSQRLGSP